MEFVGVEIDPLLHVADEGVVGPGIPQAGDHIEELAGAGIPDRVVEMSVPAEIQGLVRVAGGDEVPAGAAVRDMVEGGELPGHMVRLVIGRGGRGDEPDPFGDGSERRQQGHRVEGRHGSAALQRGHGHVHHRQMVGHEERIELGRLQSLGEALEMGKAEIRVRISTGIAPPGGVDADRPHEGAEMEATRLGHPRLSPSGA